MAATVYTLISREKKSRIIADWLRDNRPDVDRDVAQRMEQYGRDAVAELAGMRADPPHRWTTVSDQTWEWVCSRLAHPVHTPPQSEDPFQGIEGH